MLQTQGADGRPHVTAISGSESGKLKSTAQQVNTVHMQRHLQGDRALLILVTLHSMPYRRLGSIVSTAGMLLC